MIHLLQAAASRHPNATAVISQSGAHSYADLAERANRLAGGLQDQSLRRFGVLEPDAAAVISLLAAAAMTGAEPCLYQPDLGADHIARLRQRLDHEVLLGSARDADVDLSDLEKAPVKDRSTGASEAGLLVLTTGTTGEPRAARHLWNRLTQTVRSVRTAPDQRWLLAYGLQQFAGLQVLMHVVAASATLVAPFPRQPRDGARAIGEHAVTHLSATPTYWRFLLAELRAQGIAVPDLRQVTLGGEAAPDDLLAELRERFPNARISHVYAGTEFGSTSSVRDGKPGLPISVLTEDPLTPIGMKIVDGELWIRSAVSMEGYYGTAPLDPGEWRASGDLVEVIGNRVLFRGRSSELINVGGVKVHPLPIEDRINPLPGVEMCKVFGRTNRLVGNVVAVEVVAAQGVDTAALDDMIRAACADLVPAARPRSVRFVEHLGTRGGKLVRREDA